MINSFHFPGNRFRRNVFMLSLLVTVLVLVNPFTNGFIQARETKALVDTVAPIQLSPEQLKSFEGVFQNPRNNDMYVQFAVKGNALTGKLLWNNNEIGLVPESASSFVSTESGEEGPIHIRFLKDSSGVVGKVSVGNNELWSKMYNYKPLVRTEMKHEPEQLKPFEGLYEDERGRNQFIQMTVRDNKLVIKQHWDGSEIVMVPQTELDFFNPQMLLYTCSFSKGPDGAVKQALIFKRDKWNKTEKIRMTMEQLKIYEGKYQFKDDPDNFIRISARGNNLVVKQLWDSKEIILEPQVANYFYNNEQSYPLLAILDKSGAVLQVRVLDLDLFDKVKE